MRLLLPDESLRIAPKSGIGRYTYELIHGFHEHEAIIAMETFRRGSVGYKNIDQLEQPSSHYKQSTVSKIKHIILENSNTARHLHSFLKDKHYNKLLTPFQNYIYHEPNFILRPFEGLKVTTIHDLSIIHYPEFHPKLRVKYFMENIENTLEVADHIVVDSNIVRNEISNVFGVSLNKITTVPLGVSNGFQPRNKLVTQPILKKFGLNYKKFLLIVGTVEPRKNLKRLIEAYNNLPHHIQDQYPLVMTGQMGWDNALRGEIDTLRQSNRIISTDYVSEEVLQTLYASASTVLFASLYEGFGLPALEATASGTPVITSKGTAMEEIVGDVGLLVDPLDVENISENILEVLNNNKYYCSNEFYEQTTLHCQKFCWQNTIENTLNVYKNLR